MKLFKYVLSIVFLSTVLVAMENNDFSFNKEYLVKRIKDKISRGSLDVEEEIDWEEELPHNLLLAQDLNNIELLEDTFMENPEKVQQLWTNLCSKWNLPKINIASIHNDKK